MAVIHGKDMQHMVVARDVSADTKQVDISVDIDTADVTAAGDDSKEFLEGVYGWSMDGSYNWNGGSGQNDATIFGTITSGSQNVQLLPGGGTNASGNNPMYRGNAIIKSYKISCPHDGAVSCTASYQGNGAINRYTSGNYSF